MQLYVKGCCFFLTGTSAALRGGSRQPRSCPVTIDSPRMTVESMSFVLRAPFVPGRQSAQATRPGSLGTSWRRTTKKGILHSTPPSRVGLSWHLSCSEARVLEGTKVSDSPSGMQKAKETPGETARDAAGGSPGVPVMSPRVPIGTGCTDPPRNVGYDQCFIILPISEKLRVGTFSFMDSTVG